MKESISMTTIFQIVILFILLFTAIMCLTINNTNAFGVKDEIVNIIENAQGNFFKNGENGRELSEDIVNTMKENQYRTTGRCKDGYTGYQQNGTMVNEGDKASVCIKKVEMTKEIENYLKGIFSSNKVETDEFMNGYYYQIEVFYQLNMPIINEVYSLSTKGETKILYKNR